METTSSEKSNRSLAEIHCTSTSVQNEQIKKYQVVDGNSGIPPIQFDTENGKSVVKQHKVRDDGNDIWMILSNGKRIKSKEPATTRQYRKISENKVPSERTSEPESSRGE